jgi:hypothetical protein
MQKEASLKKLPEVVEFYLSQINQALAHAADIVVHTGDGGPMYVREVAGRNAQQKADARTLTIGPVTIPEMEQLRTFIRSRLQGPVSNAILGPDQITALINLANKGRPN